MSPQEIEQVQTSWNKIVPIKEKAAELFYAKLFELDPALKPLFKGNMTEQGRMLMAVIHTAVTSLTALDRIVPVVQDLGRRHAGYGVKASDYDTVAVALLWTLGAGLGDAFTDEVEQAWTETYVTLATVMKEAAATSPT